MSSLIEPCMARSKQPRYGMTRYRLTLQDWVSETNAHNQYIFNKMVEKNQTTILIHVDDLMIASTDQSCIDEVIMGINTICESECI